MTERKINYQRLLEDALKSVAREALRFAQVNGLGNNAHFYITFKTREKGVVIPDFLTLKYPDIMTIVLQYSFSNLNVSDEEFGVMLTFDGRPFYIRVPFSALVEFKDPSTDFILQFHPERNGNIGNDLELPLEENIRTENKIVCLDDFRRSRKS